MTDDGNCHRTEGRRQGAGIRKGGNGQTTDGRGRKALPNFECLMLNSQLKVERELKTAFSIFNFERLMFNWDRRSEQKTRAKDQTTEGSDYQTTKDPSTVISNQSERQGRTKGGNY